MLRPLFRCVLLLHPPYFRKRFADEMLSIFDHAVGARAEFLLLIDGLVSLARQWGLRPEFWESVSPMQQLDPDGVPSFYTFAPFHPQTQAVVHGLLLSVAFFCLICFGIRYSSIRILHVNIPTIQFDEPIASQVGPSTERATSKASPDAPASQHKAVIALPPPGGTSDYPPKAPVGIATQNKSLGTAGSSKAQGASRFSASPLNAGRWIGITLQDYVGTYVVQSRGNLTIQVSRKANVS
jgi:hypothetical protein